MFKAYAKGLGTTLRFLFAKKLTVQYPERKRERAPRFRGLHELRRYDNGLEMCIGCELCQVACPVGAITVIPAENDPEKPVSPGERYAQVWQVDALRCIFCGMCEEACPTEALHLTNKWELADFSRDSLVFGKDRLLAKTPGTHSVPEHVYPQSNAPGKAPGKVEAS